MGRMISNESDFGTIAWQKAVNLCSERLVELDSYNPRTDKLMFTVEGESGEYTVTIIADDKNGNCTCQWASNHDMDKMCSHELACHLFLMLRNTEHTLVESDKLNALLFSEAEVTDVGGDEGE